MILRNYCFAPNPGNAEQKIAFGYLSSFPSGRRLEYQTQAEHRNLQDMERIRNGITRVPGCLTVGGGKGTRTLASICALTLIAAWKITFIYLTETFGFHSKCAGEVGTVGISAWER